MNSRVNRVVFRNIIILFVVICFILSIVCVLADMDWGASSGKIYTSNKVGVGVNDYTEIVDNAVITIQNDPSNNVYFNIWLEENGGAVDYWISVYGEQLYIGSYEGGVVNIGAQGYPVALNVTGDLYLGSVAENDGLSKVLVIDDQGRVYYRNASTLVDNDWQWNGTYLYTTASAIGIGTDNPAYKLDVVGDIRATGTVLTEYFEVISGGKPIWKVYYVPNNTDSNWHKLAFYWWNETAGQWIEEAFFTSGGDLHLTGSMDQHAGIYGPDGVPRIILYPGSIELTGPLNITDIPLVDYGYVLVYNPTTHKVGYKNISSITDNDWSWNTDKLYTIAAAVGIGTDNPQYKLDVAGDAKVNNLYLDAGAGEGSIFNVDIIKGYNDIRFQLGDDSYRFEFQDTSGNVKAFINASGYVFAPRFYITEEGSETSPKWHIDYVPDPNNRLTINYDTGGTPTELVAVTPEGNVGIGTSTPQYKLDVIGDIRAGIAHIEYAMITEGGSDTGWVIFDYFPDNGRISIKSPSGPEVFTITPSGNVGIGTTNPKAKLEVVGDFRFTDPNDEYRFYKLYFGAYNDFAYNATAMVIHPAWDAVGYDPNGVVYFSPDPHDIKVGIGTDNPQYKLHVKGHVAVEDNGIVGYEILSSDDGKHWFVGYDPGCDYFYIDEVGVARQLVITNGGNVGIGTTNPAYKLDVAGDIRANSAKVHADHFIFTESGTDTAFDLDYFPNTIYREDNTQHNAIGVSIGGTGRMFVDDAGYIYTPRLYITEEGSENMPHWYLDYYSNEISLHIIYTDPQNGIKADNIVFKYNDEDGVIDLYTGGGYIITDGGDIYTLGGDIRTDGGAIHTGKGGKIYTDELYITYSGYADEFKIYYDNTDLFLGYIYTSTGNIVMKLYYDGDLWIRGYLTEGSSIRFKTDIRPLEIDTSLIYELTPMSFKWKTTGEEDFGLIAEDVAKIIPELVTFDENGTPIGIKYSKLAVLMLPELKKHEMSIEWLNKTVEKLMRDVEALKEAIGTGIANQPLILHGVIELNETGYAVIKLPEYFKYIVDPSEVTVHLTKYGEGDVYVYKIDLENNRVIIKGTPGLQVSWLVLGPNTPPSITP